jgi:hypothetical protein
MCDYLDVGNAKGRSEEKIQGAAVVTPILTPTVHLHLKAMFRHGLLDIHCNLLLLGCTAKNECVRLLDPFVGHASICRQITILDGPSFAQELAPIKSSFHSVQFCNIFRTQGLDDTRQASSLIPSPPRTPLTNGIPTPTKTPRSRSSGPPSLDELINPTASKTGPVLQNKHGQRVDLPLRYSSKEVAELKGRKLCNSFYLLGRCSSEGSSGKCQHDHTAELSKQQMTVLRGFARRLPCRLGPKCRELTCIRGHHCAREKCVRERCWYPSEMHDVDTDAVAAT